MSRGQRIARALSRAHTRLAGIYYEGSCLTALEGDQVTGYPELAKWSTGWWLDRKTYSDITSGTQYRRLVIDDPNCERVTSLRRTTAVQIGEYRFKFVAKPDFLGSLPSYEFRLEPTGERV